MLLRKIDQTTRLAAELTTTATITTIIASLLWITGRLNKSHFCNNMNDGTDAKTTLKIVDLHIKHHNKVIFLNETHETGASNQTHAL